MNTDHSDDPTDKFFSSHLGEMTAFKGNQNDLRLKTAETTFQKTFMAIDAFLKDGIYKSLGIGDIWPTRE